MPHALCCASRWVGDAVVVDVAGDLVVGPQADSMWREMKKLSDDGADKIVLNLSGLQYIDSTGVGALLAAGKSAAERHAQLRLCNVPPQVSEVLRTLRVASIFEMYANEAGAIASFNHSGP
jgi:anti-sigma B factor antagonist